MCGLACWQLCARVCRWLLTKNYKALSRGQRGNVTSFVNIIMELKKCCNHAHLTRVEEESEGQDRMQVSPPPRPLDLACQLELVSDNALLYKLLQIQNSMHLIWVFDL